jgi:hypothetical protein
MFHASRGCERGDMPEVVISFRRPPTMSSSEMRAWVIDRALVRQRALVLSVPDASWGQGLRLRLKIDDSAITTAEEELADLMMDMRLLGLAPEVLTADQAIAAGTEDR